MSESQPFEQKLVRNKTRRVFFWLTVISLAFTVMWAAMAIDAAADQEALDERCDQSNIFTDADWGEVCGEAAGNAIGAGLLLVFAAMSLAVTVACFVVFLTRDKLKPVYVAQS